MDLYEALKAGTSCDELVKTFQKELGAAKAKLDKEAETRKNQELDKVRANLAIDIKDYLAYLIGEEYADSFSDKDIYDTLCSLENSMKEIAALYNDLLVSTNTVNKPKENNKPKEKTAKVKKTDDEIIKDFLSLFD